MKKIFLITFIIIVNLICVSAQSRFYIKHADKLYKNQLAPDAEILVGNVHLKKDAVTLWCDSARYYNESGSFDAFGHVLVKRADTLSLVCDTLFYDGASRTTQALNNITLKNRKSRLVTNQIDYDELTGVAVYTNGGTLYRDGATLFSEWGEYNTITDYASFIQNVQVNSNGTNIYSDSLNYDLKTKDADFLGNVILKTEEYDIVSTRLLYNTGSEMATIVAPTNITNTDGTFIYSEKGTYDVKNDAGNLLTGSYIIHDMRTISGDSLCYDKVKGINEAFYNVKIIDEENRLTLTGGHCWYNEQNGDAMATDSALVMDWSEVDTVFLHADSLKLFTYNINTDSVHRILRAYHKVKLFRNDIQAVCDSLVFVQCDSCTYLYGQPIVWQENNQITGEEIRAFNNDSTIRLVRVINQAMIVECLDSISYNQISGREILAYFEAGKLIRNEAHGNVIVDYFFDEENGGRIGMNYSESSDLKVFMKDQKVNKIWMPATTGTMYPADKIPLDKRYLPGFAWFESIRPINGKDVFRWEEKDKKHILKKSIQRTVPLQKLSEIK